MRRVVGVAAVVLLAVIACATPQTPEEKEAEREKERAKMHAQRVAEAAWMNVRVTANPEAVRGCRSLGTVRDEATNILGSGSANVEKGMKKKAAEMGGNVIFVISTQTHRYSEGSGEVYACPAEPDPPPTPTPTPKAE